MGTVTSDAFEATPLQRTIITVVAGVLLAFCLNTLQTTYHLGSRALDVAGHGGRNVPARLLDLFLFTACAETLIAFAGFCCLTIVWAILQPAWAARAFNFLGKHVWHVLIAFILGFVALMVLFVAVTPR